MSEMNRADRRGVRGRRDRRATGAAPRRRARRRIFRSIAISVYPELEMLMIYLSVLAVLVARPRGLFGGAAA
jgi:hypothetical protein